MAIKDLLQKLGILTQKVEALEAAQKPKQETTDENSTDENGGGEGAGAGDGEGNGDSENEGNANDSDNGDGEGEGSGESEEQSLQGALQAIEGLTQKVTKLETGFATYKADLDKTFNARVEQAAQEKLASSAGTPLQTGPASKEDRGALSTTGLKGRAATIAQLKAEREGAATK